MLSKEGLRAEQQSDLEAYLKTISPDDAEPAPDFSTLFLTRRSDLARPTGGDEKRGKTLTQIFCDGCHGAGKVRPPLTQGLYEPDYLVKRVRWLPGHDARQMPPISVDRLTDAELRDVITFLTGAPSKKIFNRTKKNP
jgi:mono/diheme cytochrome c family protein